MDGRVIVQCSGGVATTADPKALLRPFDRFIMWWYTCARQLLIYGGEFLVLMSVCPSGFRVASRYQVAGRLLVATWALSTSPSTGRRIGRLTPTTLYHRGGWPCSDDRTRGSYGGRQYVQPKAA